MPAPLLAALAAAAALSSTVCTPEAFGAKADGHADDTAALQQALERCRGGGRVRLARGTYLSGPLEMRSGTTLEVAAGAVLQAVGDMARYRDGERVRSFLTARDAQDVTLTGAGVIDGAGEAWWPWAREQKAKGIEPPRPRLILMDHVARLRVSGLTLRNSPTFHLVPNACEDVVIEDVIIRAPVDAPNTDGIDPSGRRMVIRRVDIDVGDDQIAIKSGRVDPAHPGAATGDIEIRDSVLRHGHGLSIGSETNGGVRDVRVENVRIEGSDAGLRIKTPRGRGGEVSRISYRHVRLKDVRDAVLVTAYYPRIPADGTDDAQAIGPLTPDIHDIFLEDVTDEGGVKRLGGVYGLPERAVRGVRFENVRLTGAAPLVVRHAEVTLHGSTLTAPGGDGLKRETSAAVTGAR